GDLPDQAVEAARDDGEPDDLQPRGLGTLKVRRHLAARLDEPDQLVDPQGNQAEHEAHHATSHCPSRTVHTWRCEDRDRGCHSECPADGLNRGPILPDPLHATRSATCKHGSAGSRGVVAAGASEALASKTLTSKTLTGARLIWLARITLG